VSAVGFESDRIAGNRCVLFRLYGGAERYSGSPTGGSGPRPPIATSSPRQSSPSLFLSINGTSNSTKRACIIGALAVAPLSSNCAAVQPGVLGMNLGAGPRPDFLSISPPPAKFRPAPSISDKCESDAEESVKGGSADAYGRDEKMEVEMGISEVLGIPIFLLFSRASSCRIETVGDSAEVDASLIMWRVVVVYYSNMYLIVLISAGLRM
jgi:hypothetical protein